VCLNILKGGAYIYNLTREREGGTRMGLKDNTTPIRSTGIEIR